MYSLGDDCMRSVSYEIFQKLANHFSKITINLMLRRQFSCIVICCTFPLEKQSFEPDILMKCTDFAKIEKHQTMKEAAYPPR